MFLEGESLALIAFCARDFGVEKRKRVYKYGGPVKIDIRIHQFVVQNSFSSVLSEL